MLAKLILS